MPNYAPIYRLKAFFSRGALTLGRHARFPHPVIFRRGSGTIGIGERLSARSGVVVNAQDGRIEIGNNVSLQDHTVLLGHGGIRIGNDVRIAAHVVIASFDHNIDDVTIPIRKQGISKKPVVIEDDVWIGAGAKILGGAHIAKGCVIGANSVVKGKTQPFGIYVGSPARRLRDRGAP